MHAPIVEDAAGNAPAAAPPIARLRSLAHPRLDTHDLANALVFLDVIDGAENATIPVPIVVGREHHAGFLGGSDHGVTLGGGDGQRLLANHMATGLETLQRELRVRVVRRDDRDEVDIRLAEHFGDRGVSLNAGKIGLGDFQALGIDLADGHRCHTGLFHFLEVTAPHVEGAAVADDADANL